LDEEGKEALKFYNNTIKCRKNGKRDWHLSNKHNGVVIYRRAGTISKSFINVEEPGKVTTLLRNADAIYF